MGSFNIKKGLRLKLAGAPAADIEDAPATKSVSIFPADYEQLKLRLKVKEGDSVKRGSALLYDKRNERFQVCSPVAGTVKAINYGPRRFIESVVIEVAGQDAAESFTKYTSGQLAGLSREAALDQLQQSGLLALIRQRPFGRMAQPGAEPKAIFVNAMATAPFGADINAAVKGSEAAFQAGLDVLKRLTKGAMHLCLDGKAQNAAALASAKNVDIHTFTGDYPAGNTSVHISRIAPMKPADIVWTVQAVHVILIGQLFLDGQYPARRIIAVAGAGIQEKSRKHYRILAGAPLQTLLGGKLVESEQRIIRGSVFSGIKTTAQDSLHVLDTALTVIREDRSRLFLGWMAPGFNLFSLSKSFVSGWTGGGRTWDLGTNQHGELRPMVLTGLYDKYMPMNILVDYLVRAVLANDTEEAIKLGILETLPEDFAAAAFACPSKMDLVGIIRKGLEDIEKEGI